VKISIQKWYGFQLKYGTVFNWYIQSPWVLISTSYIEEKKLKNEIHMLEEEYKRNEIELELNKKKLDSLERSEIQLLKDIFGDNRK